LVCAIFISNPGKFFLILAFILYGARKGGMDTVQRTLASELSPKEYRATGLGSFQLVVGLCAFPASFAAGVLWERVGAAAPFYFSLFLTLISLTMLFFIKEKRSLS
jgi:MFS family permease